MKKIQMVDLLGQHNKIKHELDLAINDVIETSRFINGPQVKSFQESLEKYLEVDYVIPCGNGTDALQIAYMALGLPRGSEVIVPTFNYVAAAEAAALIGLKPVFVDVDPRTFNVSTEHIENAVTENTSAIVVVHLYGQSANIEPILKFARNRGLPVIEDTAQALGADYTSPEGVTKKAGTFADIGTTSFFPTKCLGAMGDGGAIFTSNRELADTARRLAFHGQSSKYVYGDVGCNSRLDSMQAAILEVKLAYLNDYIDTRRKNAAKYSQALEGIDGIEIPFEAQYSTHVYHQYTLKLANRDAVQKMLSENDIPFVTYYPGPLHLEKAYEYLGYKTGDFPTSEGLCESALSIPMHTELEDDQIEFIANVLNKL